MGEPFIRLDIVRKVVSFAGRGSFLRSRTSVSEIEASELVSQ